MGTDHIHSNEICYNHGRHNGDCSAPRFQRAGVTSRSEQGASMRAFKPLARGCPRYRDDGRMVQLSQRRVDAIVVKR